MRPELFYHDPITFAPRSGRSQILGNPLLWIMGIELHPAVSLTEGTFNVLVGPVEMLAGALNGNLELQRYKILFICGNYSRILSRLDRNFTEIEIRRAFTSFQLLTTLEENHHTFLIVEHDPMLYEDAEGMLKYVALSLRQTSRDATILLYSPALDPCLQKMAEMADRMFCIYEDKAAPAKRRTRVGTKMLGAQASLEAFS